MLPNCFQKGVSVYCPSCVVYESCFTESLKDWLHYYWKFLLFVGWQIDSGIQWGVEVTSDTESSMSKGRMLAVCVVGHWDSYNLFLTQLVFHIKPSCYHAWQLVTKFLASMLGSHWGLTTQNCLSSHSLSTISPCFIFFIALTTIWKFFLLTYLLPVSTVRMLTSLKAETCYILSTISWHPIFIFVWWIQWMQYLFS